LLRRIIIRRNNLNPESSEAFLYLGSIAMLLNRLYPRCSFLITLYKTPWGCMDGNCPV
jgi:hypothetical protein